MSNKELCSWYFFGVSVFAVFSSFLYHCVFLPCFHRFFTVFSSFLYHCVFLPCFHRFFTVFSSFLYHWVFLPCFHRFFAIFVYQLIKQSLLLPNFSCNPSTVEIFGHKPTRPRFLLNVRRVQVENVINNFKNRRNLDFRWTFDVSKYET